MKWIAYCEKKNQELIAKSHRLTSFAEIIEELNMGNFVVIKNSSKNHRDQECFLVEIHDYPILVPFNTRNEIIQLITFFPSRRLKNG